MSNSENRPGLHFSPAAQSALDEVANDIRDELSWRAATIANKGGDGPTLVSVVDVAAAVEQHSAGERRLRGQLRLMHTTGAFLGLLGLTSLAINLIVNGRSNGPLIVIGAVTIGAATPSVNYWLMGLLFGDRWRLGRRGDKPTASDIYDFMRLWITIESAVRATYSEIFGESRSSLPITSMLTSLQKAGMMDASVSKKLNDLRLVRNEIVHSEELFVTRKKIDQLSRDGRTILSQLSNGPSPTQSRTTR